MFSQRNKEICAYLEKAGPCTVSQVANEFGIEPANLLGSVSRMVKLGIVIKDKPPSRYGGKVLLLRLADDWFSIMCEHEEILLAKRKQFATRNLLQFMNKPKHRPMINSVFALGSI